MVERDRHRAGAILDNEVLAAALRREILEVVRQHNRVADLDCQRTDFTVIQGLALTYGNHFALVGLFLGGTGQDDAPGACCFLFLATDDHTVIQRKIGRAHV